MSPQQSVVGAVANFDLWGVAEKRRKKKKEKKEKERKKKVFTLKIRFQNYTFFDEFWGLLYPFPKALTP